MQTVSKVIKKLIQNQPYYGLLLCGINKYFSNIIPTAGVGIEGINYKLVVNKDFWNELTEEQRYEVILHECLHIAFFHPVNFTDLTDKKACNIAADFEVNSYLDVSKLPEGCLDPADYGLPPKLGLREYYRIILENNKKQAPDDRLLELYNSYQPDHINLSELSEEERELIKEQIKHQMQEAAKSCGSIPGELTEIFKQFEIKKKVFDWKRYFRRIMATSFSVLRKKTKRHESKRFPDFDGTKRRLEHKILVGIDTSGSVSDKELSEFFGEINKIYKEGVYVYILECDAKITKEYKYAGHPPTKVSGRGGRFCAS